MCTILLEPYYLQENEFIFPIIIIDVRRHVWENPLPMKITVNTDVYRLITWITNFIWHCFVLRKRNVAYILKLTYTFDMKQPICARSNRLINVNLHHLINY